jgi:hypothetical protein
MGKASRAKKEQRQAMAVMPGWQKEASRQAKARKREEINSHNAAIASDQIERFKSSSDQVAVIIDGKLCSGKKELAAVYASLTQQAIESDSPELLEKYLGLESLFETSIWDVKVSTLDMDHGGVETHFNPLTAAFAMDKEECFEWLIDHAFESKAGYAILNGLFGSIIPLVDHMDKSSARFRSVKLMTRRNYEHWLDDGDLEILGKLDMLASFSETITEEFRQVRRHRESMMQREEIEKSSAHPVNTDDCEPNPEAIRLAGETVDAAQEASKSEKSGRGWARAL